MPDVDVFEGAYGRLAATRVAAIAGRSDAPRARPASDCRAGAALSPLLRRLALFAPTRPSLRVPRD